MPYYNVVKKRVQIAQIIIEADSYEEAMQKVKWIPVDPKIDFVDSSEWEIDSQLGGKISDEIGIKLNAF